MMMRIRMDVKTVDVTRHCVCSAAISASFSSRFCHLSLSTYIDTLSDVPEVPVSRPTIRRTILTFGHPLCDDVQHRLSQALYHFHTLAVWVWLHVVVEYTVFREFFGRIMKTQRINYKVCQKRTCVCVIRLELTWKFWVIKANVVFCMEIINL